MGRAELLKALSELIYSVSGGADDHAEEALFEETGAREGETVLLIQQLLAEVHVVSNSIKFFEVNSHHHVHRGARLNRRYTSYGRKTVTSGLGSICQL